jgi:hypothetical protein
LIVVLVLLAIPALSLLFLQNRQVQTRLTQYMAERLSEELQASISLSSVNFSFFRRVQVRDLYIEDLHGDTLLYAGLTKLRIKQFWPEQKGLTIRKITIEDAFVNLVIDSSDVVNITFITDRLKKPHVPPEMKSRILISSIDLKNARFSLSKMVRPPPSSPWDMDNFHLSNLEIKVENLEISRGNVTMYVSALSGVESSGMEIRMITTQMAINSKQLHFSDLSVETAHSHLDIPRLEFDFAAFDRFERFSYEVDLLLSSRSSLLATEDLSYFVPGTSNMLDQLTIDGMVSGKLSDLKGDDLVVTFNDQSSLAFDFMMIGLPDFRNTFLDFNFRRLRTSIRAVNDLVGTAPDSAGQFLYPWINLGTLDFTGRFTGYPDQFVASGLLATDIGRMVIDLSFEPDSIHGVDFLGRLRTNDFRLGEFLNQERDMEQLDMDVFTDGNLYKGQIRARLDGTIDTLELFHYAYSNITLDGAFTNNTFDGGFSISDPNIKMDFKGRTDFSGAVPVFKFTADVARARPYYLNLLESDPNYFASFLVETDLSGRTLDELNGEVKLINSLFEKTDAQVQLYDVTIKTRNTPKASLIQVRSDLVDMDITGQYKLSALPGSFRNMADKYLNINPNSEPVPDTSSYFVFGIDIKHVTPLLDFFLPMLQIGDASRLSGTYDPVNSDIHMKGTFPTLEVANSCWHNVTTQTRAMEGILESGFKSDSMTFGASYSLDNQEFRLVASHDTARLAISWDNGAMPEYRGEISMRGTFQPDSVPDRGFMVDLDPGVVVIKDVIWDIQSAFMLLRKGYLMVDSFEANSDEKRILADGVISSEEEQDFHLDVRNLNLAGLPNLTGTNAELAGDATGYINYQRSGNIPVVSANIEVDSLYLNRQFLGKTGLEANWDDAEGTVRIKLLSEVDGIRIVEVSGDYLLDSKALDFDIRLNRFDLVSLNPYTSGIVHDMSGTAFVYLTLDGTLEAPELNGTIAFKDGAATFDYLNTRYICNDQVRIYRNNFYLENFVVQDQAGNMAQVSGSVANTHLRDFYISLNINASNLQCMNTQSRDNDVFYGTIFASGNAGISGPPDNIRLNITASTERNTALFLPLYNASEVVTSDFLTFIREEEVVAEPVSVKAQKIKGLQLDLEVDITNDAVVQLIFDPKVGDIIETGGNGDLRIQMDQSNGFRMFGDVILEQGDYLFTLQNVINKRFKIEPGGKISFNGSPMDASIDLEAIYTTRAAPYNLYPDLDDTKESLKKRIPVECHLILQGELRSPTISTGIYMPTADAETRNLLENSTSTDEELMKQFLSLLVINNFYSVSGYGSQPAGPTGSIAGVTASELLSNQLSNWLSQISDDFDIGVNYRPGDQITSDELELALSTQLLDDRVIITGNVDVGGQGTNPSSDASSNPYIMGDFDVEFRVTDNISIIAFNRARDELLFETAPYKQGVGISYREEFDDLGQLVDRYKEGLSNRKKRNKKSAEPETDE